MKCCKLKLKNFIADGHYIVNRRLVLVITWQQIVQFSKNSA